MAGLTRNPEATKGVIRTYKAPEDHRLVGQTPTGDPIYEETVEVVVGKQPVVINGEEQWRKHPTTGEPLYPLMRKVVETQKRRYVPWMERNSRGVATGNWSKNYNFEADPEERARLDRQRKIEDMQRALAEGLVDRGLDPDALLEALSGPDEADDDLPSIRDLPDALAQLDDPEAVRILAENDDRKSARAIYDKRLRELEAGRD